MAVRVVRLGSPRSTGEGLRIGTVRRPPRGVPKAEFAKRDYYDVWLPQLSPSAPLVALAQRRDGETERDAGRRWRTIERRFRAEMKRKDAARLLDLLAALSHRTDFAIGCYCDDESHCHRLILRALFAERGAAVR